MLYYFDANGRYIGSRARIADESIPNCATETPVTVPDGHEAYHANGTWTVTTIPPAPVVEALAPVPTPEQRIADLEAEVAQLTEILEAIT
jgi:hypothetical protein